MHLDECYPKSKIFQGLNQEMKVFNHEKRLRYEQMYTIVYLVCTAIYVAQVIVGFYAVGTDDSTPIIYRFRFGGEHVTISEPRDRSYEAYLRLHHQLKRDLPLG